MRIDIVTDTFAPDINGVAMTLGRLVQGLRRNGHLVHIIRAGEEQSAGAGDTSARFLRLPGYREIRVGLPRPVKFRKRWSRKRPDAVYVATESPMGYSALQAAQSLGIPSVTGFHTCFHDYLEQYRLGGLKAPMLAWLRKIHELADLTVTPSADVAATLREHSFQNVAVLGRGVDSDLFHPKKRCEALREQWQAAPQDPVYLFVGRAAPEKNLEFGLQVFREIRRENPAAKAVVVGDGPSRIKLAEKYSEVTFAGMQCGEDLAKYYASSDVLLFPSETETFGNVLLEGMASGLVTLSYDYAASGVHVVDGRNGLKVPCGAEDEFIRRAKATAKVASWRDLGRAARKHSEQFGWSQIVSTFEGLLQETAECYAASPSFRAREQFLEFESIFLSDLHLGTPESKTKELVDFLKHTRCQKLFLNGDIIDGWALKRGTSWSKRHTRVIRTILKKSEKEETEVIYLRGNHDDILERFFPIDFGTIKLRKEAVHEGIDGRRYLVVHGDGFDHMASHFRWVAMLGAFGYDSVLRVNRWYNHYRKWRGKPYLSISKQIKERVKNAVSFVGKYEEQLVALAHRKNCDGIICGHIHTPKDKTIADIRYLNSGDWVESMSCVVEHTDGTFEVLLYSEFLKRLGENSRSPLGHQPRNLSATAEHKILA